MAQSDWNAFIARLLCGWKRRDARIGEQLLRDLAQLDGRTLARARAGLVAKGLIVFQAGSGGRGNRGLYVLVLDTETPAPQRTITDAQTPAVERENRPDVNTRSGGT